MSQAHWVIILVSLLITVVLDIYVFIRLIRLAEGLSGRVIFWSLLTVFVPVIGALGVLMALPSSESATHVSR